MGIKVANNAFGTLAASLSDVATTLSVNAGEGARFPTLGAGDYFFLTLIDTANNIEIVKVTARSSDSMTIVRGQDGTTAKSYAVNDRVELRPTAALFDEKADVGADVNVSQITGTLPPSKGGTGITSPGTSGNVLTSDGTTWTSAAIPSSAPTTAQVLSALTGVTGNAVGAYAFITGVASGSVLINGTFAGSNARGYDGSNGTSTYNPGFSGTWKNIGGGTLGVTGYAGRGSLCVRIS